MQIKYLFCNRISQILPLFASGIVVKYLLKSVQSHLQNISNSSDSSNTHVSYASEWYQQANRPEKVGNYLSILEVDHDINT
jgi:hypothetical protein